MKKFKKMALTALSLCLTASFAFTAAACTGGGDGDTDGDGTVSYSHDFTEQVKSWEKKTNAKAGISYYTAKAVYCENPTHPGNQTVAIYSPTAYLNEDGTINKSGTVNGYTADTAPIIYWNSHGSYVGMGPFEINGASTRHTGNGWVLNMIKEGFVICMVGERGKQTVNENNEVIGRGPIAISDLKAGVRFLKYNDAVIPGSSQKIVSVGTSSGGAMSALLGTSGNNEYYNTYLEEMGAVMTETDDVFATMAYCPITDLDHAAFAYEWVFGEDLEGHTDFQKALSEKFIAEYVSYINGLELTDSEGNSLTLAEDGSKSGSYYDWLMSKYEESYENFAANFDAGYKDYVTSGETSANAADDYDWINYDATTGKATMVCPEGYDSALDALVLSGFRARQKSVISFDTFDPIGGDNEVFGEQGSVAGTAASARHFNQRIAEIIGGLQEEFPDEYAQYYQAYYDDSHIEEIQDWVKYLNSYTFLTDGAESTVSSHFRINMGVQDADTAITVSATLALLLEMNDVDTEFNIMWGWGHNDCDTPTGLTDWVNSICK